MCFARFSCSAQPLPTTSNLRMKAAPTAPTTHGYAMGFGSSSAHIGCLCCSLSYALSHLSLARSFARSLASANLALHIVFVFVSMYQLRTFTPTLSSTTTSTSTRAANNRRRWRCCCLCWRCCCYCRCICWGRFYYYVVAVVLVNNSWNTYATQILGSFCCCCHLTDQLCLITAATTIHTYTYLHVGGWSFLMLWLSSNICVFVFCFSSLFWKMSDK